MKKLVFATSLLATLCVLTLQATTTKAAAASTQNGISIQSRSSTDFASDTFKKSVDNAVNDGVNYITLVVSVHQNDRYTNSVAIDSNTPTDDAIRTGANYIHSKGIKVAIAVHDDLYDGWWRALIAPTDPTLWFSNYATILNHYATLSQSAGIDEISIGTEMSSMTASVYTNNWITMIKSVRNLYSGSLTYSAQHYGGYSDAQTLGFWSYLDYIGISAYYPLNGATTKADLEAQWKNWDQQEISVLANKYNKPILFTEVGFVSRDNATTDPATGFNLTTPINTALQATAYDALLDYFHTSSSVKGMFFWDWSSDPSAGGLGDGNFTPQNKPAEAVMKQWFSSTSTPIATGVYSATATVPVSTKNTTTTDTIAITTPYPTSDALVDVEIYTANGQRVAQSYSEHQSLSQTASIVAITWTPPSSGTYTIKVGLFSAGWQSTLYWNDAVSKIVVSDMPPVTIVPPVTVPVAPVTPVTPPVVSPTTPVTTLPASLPTAITIWWPSNGSTVSGIQPFKALISGRDSATYDMFWQVGTGQLNVMTDNSSGGAHKEASVDLTGWNWNSNKQYVITFVAKNKDGSAISQQSTTITIN